MSDEEQITAGELNSQNEGAGIGAGTPEPQGQGNDGGYDSGVYGAPESYDFKDVTLPE